MGFVLPELGLSAAAAATARSDHRASVMGPFPAIHLILLANQITAFPANCFLFIALDKVHICKLD